MRAFYILTGLLFAQAGFSQVSVSYKIRLAAYTSPRVINNGFYGCGLARTVLNNQPPALPVTGPVPEDSNKAKIIMRCGGTTYSNSQPLIILDGIPPERNSELGLIDPKEIENITVLKSSAASAIYGCRAMHGAILITTKKAAPRKIIIKDFFDQSLIPGATISVISYDKRDTLNYIADDSGRVVTGKLRRGAAYEMVVSSVGYKPVRRNIPVKIQPEEEEILLARDIKVCEKVTITTVGYVGFRCGGCWLRCIKCYRGDTTKTSKPVSLLKIFPVPAPKGSVLKISISEPVTGSGTLRVLDLSGRLMMQKPVTDIKENQVIELATDPHWAAGIYFLQWVYVNGRVAASGRIVIQ